MKKIIICLFLSAGLSGCHVYRTYERPDMTVTDSLYRQPVGAAGNPSPFQFPAGGCSGYRFHCFPFVEGAIYRPATAATD